MNDFLDNKIIYQDLENIYNNNINWMEFENKSIFITGAYGMLASYCVFLLIYLNEVQGLNINIIVAVRNKNKLINRFGKYIEKDYFKIYSKNINEPIVFNGRIDYVIHAASLASPQYYTTIPSEVLKPNILGTYYLLELSKEKNVKGFLFFSTGDIYGIVKNTNSLTEDDMGETNPLDIHSCYGESKRMGENLCKVWNHQFGVPTKIVRIFHTYAPTMDIKHDPRVFASFVNDVLNNRNIQMKSEGFTKRSFCYISDAVTGYFKVLLEGKESEAYNVCNSDEYISIMELAEIMVSLFPEKNLKVVKVKRDKSDPYLESKISNDVVPINIKLKNLGWEPKISSKEGFKRVILSYYNIN